MSALEPVLLNGVVIPEAIIAAEMQHHPAASLEAARQAAAQALVVRRLLLDAAEAQGVAGEEDARIDALIDRAVRPVEPDEAACLTYYQAHRSWFRSPDLLAAQHILLAAAPGDAEARAAARAKGGRLLAEVLRDPSCFEALAREHSDCPSKANGGHLDQITRGSTVPEFETYLFSLAEGEICGAPVESRYGVHVLRLLRRADGQALPFEHVRADIAEGLRDQRWRRAVRDFIDSLMAAAEVRGLRPFQATAAQ